MIGVAPDLGDAAGDVADQAPDVWAGGMEPEGRDPAAAAVEHYEVNVRVEHPHVVDRQRVELVDVSVDVVVGEHGGVLAVVQHEHREMAVETVLGGDIGEPCVRVLPPGFVQDVEAQVEEDVRVVEVQPRTGGVCPGIPDQPGRGFVEHRLALGRRRRGEALVQVSGVQSPLGGADHRSVCVALDEQSPIPAALIRLIRRGMIFLSSLRACLSASVTVALLCGGSSVSVGSGARPTPVCAARVPRTFFDRPPPVTL